MQSKGVINADAFVTTLHHCKKKVNCLDSFCKNHALMI